MTDRPRATLYRCTSRELAEKLPDRPDIVFTAPPLWRPRKEADREKGRMAHEETALQYERRWHYEVVPWLDGDRRARLAIVLGEDYFTPIGCFGTFGVDAAAIIPWYIPIDSCGRGGQMLWWCVRIQDEALDLVINAGILLAAAPPHDPSEFIRHGITPPSIARALLEGLVVTPDTVVVDPFMGSGEHLIAALKLGARHVYGSEPSDFIFQTAVERLKDFADVETP